MKGFICFLTLVAGYVWLLMNLAKFFDWMGRRS